MADLRMPDYLVAGDGDRTVFLLHGGYGSKDYWRDEIATLVDHGYRVVAWDAPGYGISPLPDHYSIERLAQSCAELIKLTGTRTNVIFGHSMGGLIAPKVYTLIPDLVSALIISASVESFGHMEPQFQQDFIKERVAPLDQGMTFAEVAGPLVASVMAPGNSGPHLDVIVKAAASTPANTFRAAIQAIVEYDGACVVKKIAVPTLCIAGELDPIGRAEVMEALANTISGAEYVCLKNAAHYAWAEQPGAFNQALLDFLDRHVPDEAPVIGK